MAHNGDGLVPTTPREVRMCREAVTRAVNQMWSLAGWELSAVERSWKGASELAARLYPMPTVEVPRVVEEVGGVKYKVDKRHDGLPVLFVRSHSFTGDTWKSVTDAPHVIDLGRLALLADLYARPTEQRPADEVTP